LAVSDATKRQIQAQLQPLWDSGQITSIAQWDHAWDSLLINNPDAYFSVGPSYTDTWYETVSGSGFFVTEDGYLVTAAHVVTASKDGERAGIVAATLDPAFVAEEKANIQKDWATYGPSDAEINKMVDFLQRWIARYLSVDKIDSAYYVGNGSSVDSLDTGVAGGATATVVSIDPTNGGHDIAIMKSNLSGVPALPLALSAPKMGDATSAIGYPGTASVQHKSSSTISFRITVTVGSIQSMHSQTGPTGSWKVYGTNALLAHGDSGGPMLDAQGRVMGVMSFVIPDASGNQLPGQGYFEPSSWVQEDLAKANVTIPADPRKANLTNTYYRALAKGDNSRYKEELVLLQSIGARAVDPYVADDINHAQVEIRAGNDTTPPDLMPYVPPASGIGASVILLALLSWLVSGLMARPPRRVPAAPQTPADEPTGITASAVSAD
jgi:S1-C subfamily serine protease